MNLSFSTIAWQNLDWQEYINLAHDMEFSGIELACPLPLMAPGAPLHSFKARTTAREMRAKNLSVPNIDSTLDLSDAESLEDNVVNLKDIITLAAQLGCGCVSVCAKSEDEDTLRAALQKTLPHAIDNNVCILVETTGIYADTNRLCLLLDSFASDNLAALWNIYDPFFAAQEKPAITIRNLGAYVKHVHFADAYGADGAAAASGAGAAVGNAAGNATSGTDSSSTQPPHALVGEGNMPLGEFVGALASINYYGHISFVWDTNWVAGLHDPQLLLPYFENYMARFDDTSKAKNPLILNHDGTGQYVWEKYDLVDLTFSQVLDRMVEEFPDQYAFKYTTLDYTRTYSEFRRDVDNFARALISLGVRAGSKVAIWATNVPAWYITFWATTKIGAVLVTVNTAYKVHEAEYLFRQSDTHTLVMIESALDSNYKEIINELCPEIAQSTPGEPLHCEKLPFLRNVITVGFNMPGALTFEQAFDRAPSVPQARVSAMAAKVRPDDVCNMQYTSGTTGFPKGVMLTHRNVVNDGKIIGDRMGLSTADRMMIQVPMFHCFGMVLSMTSSMTHGTTMCPMPYFSAKASLACVTQERITAFNGVPTMFIAMFNHPDYKKTDFSHMRTGIMAGAGCPADLMKRAAQPDEMNMTGIVSVYGATETSPGCTMSTWTDELWLRTETVGYAFPHVECKIINPNTGEDMPKGKIGEFCSRGFNNMKGYYKMPDATHKTIDAQRWVHSGDLGRFDEQGNLYVTGRLKDMIIRGGENLYPMEIEEFIYTHPKVQDVQVVGVPDEKYGEEAVACIVLKSGKTATEDEIKEFCQASIARHKVPRYVKFVDAFPMNAAGKVLKYKMREELTHELGLEHLLEK